MKYLFGRISSNDYIIFDGKTRKFSHLKSNTTPDLMSFLSLVLRTKLSGKDYIIGKNTCVMKFFDEATFSMKSCIIVGIDEKNLTRVTDASIIDENGDFIDDVDISNLTIDYVCISPQVEYMHTDCIKYSENLRELWIPKSVKIIYKCAINCKRLSVVNIDSDDLAFNLNNFLYMNNEVRQVNITRDLYNLLSKKGMLRGNEDVVCVKST